MESTSTVPAIPIEGPIIDVFPDGVISVRSRRSGDDGAASAVPYRTSFSPDDDVPANVVVDRFIEASAPYADVADDADDPDSPTLTALLEALLEAQLPDEGEYDRCSGCIHDIDCPRCYDELDKTGFCPTCGFVVRSIHYVKVHLSPTRRSRSVVIRER